MRLGLKLRAMRGILLVDHGSRRPEGNETVERVAALVRARVGDGVRVGHAHMELAEPSVAVAIDAMAAAGVTDLVVHPFFLGKGRHASEDIPRLAREALAQHPHVRLTLTEPLGTHALLAELVLVRCAET